MRPGVPSRRVAAPASGGDELPIDVDLIKVLASDSRRDILRLLGERRRTLTELAQALGLKKATVLEHLKKLVDSGLIRRIDENERLWIYYELTPRGRRLVTPGRTRFHLIMAGAAVAAIILGAALVVALSNGLGAPDAPTRGEQALLDGRATVSVPEVVWRGMDDDVVLRVNEPARANGTLQLTGQGGAPLPLAFDVRDGAATLRGAQVDSLAPGTYALRLRIGDVEAALPQALVVRDPSVAVFPRAVVANQPATLVLSVAPDATRAPTPPNVTLDRAILPLAGAAPRYTVQLTAPSAGAIELQIGRLVRVPITVLPDLAISARAENGTLLLAVADARGPVDANVTLDGAPLGATANGTLAAPLPAEGEHLLAATAADGREAQRAIAVRGAEVGQPSARLTLSAFLGMGSPGVSRFHATVQNDGLAGETVTLAVRDGRGLLATGVLALDAGGSAPLVLETSATPVGTLVVDAYASTRTGGLDPTDAAQEPASGAPQTTPTPAATPTVAPTTTTPGSRFYADRAPDASVTLVTVTPTTMPTTSSMAEPQVPGPGVALVLAAALVVAALARRRSGTKR